MKRSLFRQVWIVAVLMAALAVPGVAQVKDHRDLKFPELPKRELPQPVVHTLANGLQIFLLEDHEVPLIRVSGRIRTGSLRTCGKGRARRFRRSGDA